MSRLVPKIEKMLNFMDKKWPNGILCTILNKREKQSASKVSEIENPLTISKFSEKEQNSDSGRVLALL